MAEVVMEQGQLSVNTENLLPIIKKFLYSDHEIFLRELVSNGVDAVQKLRKLGRMGEFNGDTQNLSVKVAINPDAKTITISDTGIGMTADEIKKYINQIAFSGAVEFAGKYKSETGEQLIGNFGLGFYSAFMVSHKVELITRSYKEGSEAVRWTSDGSTTFQIENAEREQHGTDVILHLDEESQTFLEYYKLKSILRKYASYLPVPVFMAPDATYKPEKTKEGEEPAKPTDEQINPNVPLWTRNPTELTDEDYKNFYRELYPMGSEPLFWIHLNVDYPFNLTGILYFPKIGNSLEVQRDKIQLYCRQVFVTEDVKEIVPEFLTLLHGVIDSPDIPLNVSRSYLQADGNVKKINSHITKKVADKLQELFKADRKSFEEKWADISLFVKFGMVTDEKFYERAADFALLQNTDKSWFTFAEYADKVGTLQTNKNQQKVYLYTNDPEKHHLYVEQVKARNYDVLIMDSPIDAHFIQKLEAHLEKVTFKRVDSEPVHKLIETEDATPESVLTDDQKKVVTEAFEKAANNKSYTVQVEALNPDDMPVILVEPEFMRRMKEMSRYQSGFGFSNFGDMVNVVVNGNHPLVIKIAETQNEELAKQAYDLALLANNRLSGEALAGFIKRSVSLL